MAPFFDLIYSLGPHIDEPIMTLRGCAGDASVNEYCKVVSAPNGPRGKA